MESIFFFIVVGFVLDERSVGFLAFLNYKAFIVLFSVVEHFG